MLMIAHSKAACPAERTKAQQAQTPRRIQLQPNANKIQRKNRFHVKGKEEISVKPPFSTHRHFSMR